MISRMFPRHPVYLWLFVCLCVGACVHPALGHDLKAHFQVKNGKVLIHAFFSDGTSAVKATVQIKRGDEQLRSGETAADGRCEFAAPEPGDYAVVVDAGAGHRKTFALKITAQNQVADSGETPEEMFQGRWLQLLGGLAFIALAALVMLVTVWVRRFRSSAGTKRLH